MTLKYYFDRWFEYTAEESEIISAICYIISNNTNIKDTKILFAFLEEYTNSDVQKAIFEQFREHLEDYFEQDAREEMASNERGMV